MIILLVAGCQPQPADSPIQSRPGPTAIPARPDPVISLTVDELAADPTLYAGATIRVTGAYHTRPLIICPDGVNPRRPPAAWSLVEGQTRIDVAGAEALLLPLAPRGLGLTVEGLWQQWQGTIGCGKAAAPAEMWYLLVSQVVSPNPIARVTFAPGDDDSRIAQQPAATPTLPATAAIPTPEAAQATPTLPPTPMSSPTPAVVATPTPDLFATAFFTPTAAITPTDDVEFGPTTTLTATTTFTGTTTTTPTPTPAGPTATTNPNTTPTFTPTPGGTVAATPTVTAQGTITPQEIVKGTLIEAETHTWSFTIITPTTVVTVSVVGAVDLDLSLMIEDAAGNLLAEANQVGAGLPESIVALTIPNTGEYDIVIREVDGISGPYALTFGDGGSFPLVFQKTLTYGETAGAIITAGQDHFWNFEATEGDIVTIVATPNDDSDLFIGIYDPDMELIVEFNDEGGPGETEELVAFQLDKTGLYTIWTGEVIFEPADYQLSLTLAQ